MANPPDSSQLWSPPNPMHFWSPTSIKIPNTPGQPDIELIGAFCPPKPVTAYTPVEDSTCVYFPTTLYPPIAPMTLCAQCAVQRVLYVE